MVNKVALVVDDDADFAAFVADVAEGIGYEVHTHRSARAGLDAMKAGHPSVIVMDVVMPDMDGVELVQAIGRENPEIPVIVMSGYDERYLDLVKTLGQANGARVIATLTKPFTADELETALAAAEAGVPDLAD